MKRNILTLLFLVVFCVPSVCQTESAKKVLIEVNNLKSSIPLQNVVSYLEDRQTSFDFNNLLDKFSYNLQMGVMNYNLESYQKAYPYLLITTQICDAESTEVFVPQNDFLVIYYWLAISALNIGESREQVLTKLNRAKQVFELSQLTETPLYQTILSDINVIQSDYYTLVKNASEAVALALQGKYKKAIPQLEQLLSKFPESKGYLEKAKFIQALTNCYVQTDQLKEAENLYVSAINKLDELNAQNNEVYWNLCDGLCVLYMQLHNYEKAKYFASTAKRLHEQYLNFGDGYIRCLSNCAIIEQGLGHNALAKIFMDVAMKQMRSNYIGYDETIDKIFKFGQGKSKDNELKSKVDINLKIKPLIKFLSNAASVYSEVGYRSEAISCIKESIELSKEIKEESAIVLNNLGSLYLQESEIIRADSCYNEAYKISKSSYERDLIGYNLALTKWLLNKKDSGLFAAEVSKQIKENMAFNFSFLTADERDDYWSQLELYLPAFNLFMYDSCHDKLKQDIYDNILFEKGLLLRSSNNVRDAILSSRNQTLIDKYNQMLYDQRQLLKEKDTKQQIILKNRIELADKHLTKNVDTYAKLHTRCTWENVKNKLSKNEVAIEFYNIPFFRKSNNIYDIDGEPRLCAFLLKAEYDKPHMIPLCLEHTVSNNNCGKSQDLKDLYNVIWKPLAKELKGVERIYFSPYRTLHALPIEYSVDETGQFMNEKYEMFRLSSTRMLVENISRTNVYNKVSLYGGLLYDLSTEDFIAASTSSRHKKLQAKRISNLDELRYGVKYLPGTTLEVNTIFKLFKKYNITPNLYCGLDGTEESFKNMSGVPLDILHVSTHGFYWSDEDLKTKKDIPFLNCIPVKNESMNHTGLFMTGANLILKGQEIPYDIEDGVLTAQEISSLNLENLDLVVLSACQTGLGDINNDTVYGLQRGFKFAGAKTLLVSLWNVDDKATMVLMTEFYKQLLNGNNKVESLRMAQHSVQRQYGLEHPEFWAGFVLLDALD